ncbi:hypothetical protein Tco_0863530, partial [Tanacetum coccineum]
SQWNRIALSLFFSHNDVDLSADVWSLWNLGCQHEPYGTSEEPEEVLEGSSQGELKPSKATAIPRSAKVGNVEKRRSDVFVNGKLLTDRAVKKAEKLAVPIHPARVLDCKENAESGFVRIEGPVLLHGLQRASGCVGSSSNGLKCSSSSEDQSNLALSSSSSSSDVSTSQ